MKLRVTGLIILSLFINMFSCVAVNADESNAIKAAALKNTMHVAKSFFMSNCIQATMTLVEKTIALANTVKTTEKKQGRSKTDAGKDLGQVFFAQAVSTFSLNIQSSKACTNFAGSIAVVAKDVQFTMLLMKFLKQFYVFLILMSLLYLLPRGSIDSYAIANQVYRHV